MRLEVPKRACCTLPYSTAHASGGAIDLVMLHRTLMLACFSMLSLRTANEHECGGMVVAQTVVRYFVVDLNKWQLGLWLIEQSRDMMSNGLRSMPHIN